MQGMPEPNERHRRLHQLAGTWVGNETLGPSPSGPPGEAVGRFTMWVGVDGLFVLHDYHQEKDGRVVYRGHGIFGWDEQKREYAWYWVDSMGVVPPSPSRGQWRDDTLTFEHEPLGDRRGRYTFTFRGPDSFVFTIENSQDGGVTWSRFLEGTYGRS